MINEMPHFREFEATFTVRFSADDQVSADHKVQLYKDALQHLLHLHPVSVEATPPKDLAAAPAPKAGRTKAAKAKGKPKGKKGSR